MKYATWGPRFGAHVIDQLVVLPLYIVAAAFDQSTMDPQTGEVTGEGPIYWIVVLLALALWGFNRWYLTGTTGQSWGKRALGIRLIGEATEEPIGAGKAFLRDLAHFVDGIICYIGYLFPLWDAKRQTIADKIMRTVVVG